MPNYLRLEGHFVEHTRDGMNFGTTASTFALPGGLIVQMPTPFLAIGDELAITPAIKHDGDTALRIDFTHWAPLRYGLRGVHGFPFTFPSQDGAAKVCRAFDADPRTSWRDAKSEIETWLREWGPPNGFHF